MLDNPFAGHDSVARTEGGESKRRLPGGCTRAREKQANKFKMSRSRRFHADATEFLGGERMYPVNQDCNNLSLHHKDPTGMTGHEPNKCS